MGLVCESQAIASKMTSETHYPPSLFSDAIHRLLQKKQHYLSCDRTFDKLVLIMAYT
ncbi:hypothetical protein H6G41_31830 [Tolypothrix sp. FACHB-123]|nr:hypothetical protein [Tolypothrix sp. FACHB-123]